MKILILFLSLALSVSTYAVEGPSRTDEIFQVAKSVVYEGRRLAEPYQFALDTLEMEKQAGRRFADPLIEDLARLEIRERPADPPPRCFTGRMRVLTPSGYRAISTLKAGDQVYSWDENAKKMVVNSIAKVFASPDKVEYGRLSDTLYGAPIEVTAEHPFYSATEGIFKPIGEIGAAENLLHVGHCQAALGIPRGRYEAKIGKARVYTLSMSSGPRNFIVEGVVVHNKPGRLT